MSSDLQGPAMPARPRSWDRSLAPPPAQGAGFAPPPGSPPPGQAVAWPPPGRPSSPVPRAIAPRRLPFESDPAERLSVEARSVVVPAVVALLLALVAPVALIVAAWAALDGVTLGEDGARERAQACVDDEQAIRDDLASFAQRTGTVPRRDRDIPAYDHDRFRVQYRDQGARVSPVPDGPCDHELRITGNGLEADYGSDVDADLESLAEAYTYDEPVAVVAMGLVGTALGALSWWLACAHRAVPRRGYKNVDQAYRPVRVLAIGFVVISLVQGLAIASVGDFADSTIVFFLWLGVTVVFWVAMIYALLKVADMIGDVTQELGGGVGASRVMRGALKTAVGSFLLLIGSLLAIPLSDSSAPVALVLVFLLVVLLAALVALVAYVVGVIMSTVAIESALTATARRLDAEAAHHASMAPTPF